VQTKSISASKPPFFFYVKYLSLWFSIMAHKKKSSYGGISDPTAKPLAEFVSKANSIELAPNKKAKSFSW